MHCTICPRHCGAERGITPGQCGAGVLPRVARAALHHWEEPCISGIRGSGTVFFSGCALKCCYCQNHAISAGAYGRDISVERLAEIFLELQGKGAHNINLVNPTHFTPWIAQSIRLARPQGLTIPVIWNSSGYDSPEALALMDGLVDIYLPDIKYYDSARSLRYSGAADYFVVASQAVKLMYLQAGPAQFDGSILKKGVVIRHLVLPGGRDDSIAIVEWIANNLDINDIVLSLMSQYTPCYKTADYPEINRRLTSLEYNRVMRRVEELDFPHAYCQQKSSAREEYVPEFDLEGV